MRFVMWLILLVVLVGCEKKTPFYTHILYGRLVNVAESIAPDEVVAPVFVEEWEVGRPKIGYLTGCETCRGGTLSELIGALREKDSMSDGQQQESFTGARRLIIGNGLEYLLVETNYDHLRNLHPRRFMVYSLDGDNYTLVFDSYFGHELNAWWVVSLKNEIYLYTRSYRLGDNRKLTIYRVEVPFSQDMTTADRSRWF